MNLNWLQIFRILLWISLATIALPFLLVAVEQATGMLSDQETWIVQGNQFGPWHARWERFTMFLPSVVLIPVIIVAASLLAILETRPRPLIGGLGLLSLHVAGLLIQLQALGWLVE